jgi:hypothetical protein
MAERERANSPNRLDMSQFAHPAAVDAWVEAAKRSAEAARQIGEEQLAQDWDDLVDQATRGRGQIQRDWDNGRKDQTQAADQAAQHRIRGEEPPEHVLRAAGQADVPNRRIPQGRQPRAASGRQNAPEGRPTGGGKATRR